MVEKSSNKSAMTILKTEKAALIFTESEKAKSETMDFGLKTE